ncbi:thiolase family protein [Vineibacter terrae]|uniref:Thiolase family protein n=1 Tax=Vineibacter terrae TaxID=2586908 RepID=A0A5C8P9E1_9HYPH|nr:thiolase family protein [Vineibacter terrae]TXL70183.1 thiolase family protein [Vineibacter terrae]
MAFISGVGNTRYGKIDGSTTMSLAAAAAQAAMADAGLKPQDIDGLLTGYATTMPHIMLATVIAERLGVQPAYAHALQAGGATGVAMAMLAKILVDGGRCRAVLIVAAENRASGQSRDQAIQTLAQAGHPDYEVPYGATIPAYYGLLAARYMHQFGVTDEDLAELAVVMRRHAGRHPDAHLRTPITAAEVMASKPIALPLRLLDCCPVSDGGIAAIITREPTAAARVRIRGAGQAHLHQHISCARDWAAMGAKASADRAFADAGMRTADIDYLAVYDSFTITLAMLLEEIGFVRRAGAGEAARAGRFDVDGDLPLNTHGGLLSFGHCGVGGGLAHLVETQRQLAGRADGRQVKDATVGFVHGDGGVMSSHVSMVLERV